MKNNVSFALVPLAVSKIEKFGPEPDFWGDLALQFGRLIPPPTHTMLRALVRVVVRKAIEEEVASVVDGGAAPRMSGVDVVKVARHERALVQNRIRQKRFQDKAKALKALMSGPVPPPAVAQPAVAPPPLNVAPPHDGGVADGPEAEGYAGEELEDYESGDEAGDEAGEPMAQG